VDGIDVDCICCVAVERLADEAEPFMTGFDGSGCVRSFGRVAAGGDAAAGAEVGPFLGGGILDDNDAESLAVIRARSPLVRMFGTALFPWQSGLPELAREASVFNTLEVERVRGPAWTIGVDNSGGSGFICKLLPPPPLGATRWL
jgi:hypothetical protein